MISAAFFGIYHGNVLQAVYAFVLGGIFAWFLEMGGNKWTSVLMHIGANTWILIFSEYAQTLVEKAGAGSLLMIYGDLCGGDDRRISVFCTPRRKTWLPGCLIQIKQVAKRIANIRLTRRGLQISPDPGSGRVIDEYLLYRESVVGS